MQKEKAGKREKIGLPKKMFQVSSTAPSPKIRRLGGACQLVCSLFGITPKEIVKPTEVGTKPLVADISLAVEPSVKPYLQTQAGDGVTANKSVRLLSFIRKQGGISLSDPRLDDFRGVAGRQPGLVSKDGLFIDEMQQRAIKSGYLPAESSGEEFLVLIEKDTRKRNVYPLSSTTPQGSLGLGSLQASPAPPFPGPGG